jgi:hypothetical protein
MLSSEQIRQLGEQVQFKLPGDSLGYILAELAAPNAPLDSSRELFWHRNTDLVGSPSLLVLRNHVTDSGLGRVHRSTNRLGTHAFMLPVVAKIRQSRKSASRLRSGRFRRPALCPRS